MYQYKGLGIKDEEFIRDQIPMTKMNIRILSVAKLQLEPDSVVYDVGAGTGSVSVEMAFLCPKGKIYAIEKKPEGCELIRKNIEKFELRNIEVIEGVAPDCLEQIEAPTHVFLGGSSGKLAEIVNLIRKKNPKVRFVVNAVTLETLSELARLSRKYPEYEDMEIIQAQITEVRRIADYHMMQGTNPVYIVSFSENEVE